MPVMPQHPFRLLPCCYTRPHHKSISCFRSHHNASVPHCSSSFSSSSQSEQVHRYAVLGAGFAGLSVAWHLLKAGAAGSSDGGLSSLTLMYNKQQNQVQYPAREQTQTFLRSVLTFELSARDTDLHIDVYDEVGIGGGASGVAGGLVHPYSPKVKLLWRGAECWEEALKLLRVAEIAVQSRPSSWKNEISGETIDFNGPIFWRRGIVRPATKIKNLDVMTENARHHLESCKLEVVTNDFVKKLMPDVIMPLNTAFYMPQAVNIHPMRYLQALFFACQDLSGNSVVAGNPSKGISFHKREIKNLQDLSDAYTAVIVCLGAKSGFLPELSGKLPLRRCRGIVMHMQLPHQFEEGYTENTPSILSDAWLAIQGPRDLVIGSTWDWGSVDYASAVSKKEASSALQDLIPKASAVLPNISNWVFRNAKGGMRAMPPLTELGSLPLLGCLNDLVGGKPKCRYWLIGGLGARGLVYHGWLGKLIAKAVLSCDENQLPPELTAWKRR